MALHLPRIRALAEGLDLCVEFGVKHGASSSALLMGAKRVLSFDLVQSPRADALRLIVGERWDYRIADTRTVDIPPCDLLLVDSLHTYDQVKQELDRHADKVRRFLIFHDVITFGSIGADGETGKHLWTYTPGQSVPPWALGIRPAIDQLMMGDPSWIIHAIYPDSHGLLVLTRR